MRTVLIQFTEDQLKALQPALESAEDLLVDTEDVIEIRVLRLKVEDALFWNHQYTIGGPVFS